MNSPAHDPRLSQAMEAARLALEGYRHDADLASQYLNDFGERMQRAEPEWPPATSDTDVAQVGKRLWATAKDLLFLYRVCELKMDWFAQALLDALRAENPLALANNARAFVEHLAALHFVGAQAQRLLGGLEGQGSQAKIDEHFSRLEKALQRCYYGHSPKAQGAEVKAYHVEGDFLESLKADVPDIGEVYAFLCEYVHPNYGSNLLVSSGQLGTGRLRPPIATYSEPLTKICSYCILSTQLARDLLFDFRASLIQFQKYIEIAQQPQTRISTLFSFRAAEPEGDGKTKDSAFFFPRARTHAEGVEMIYRYLKANNLKVGLQHFGGTVERFVYDFFDTQEGPVWFKTRVTGSPSKQEK